MKYRTILIVLAVFISINLIDLACASSYNVQFNQVETKTLIRLSINLDNQTGIFIPIPKDAAGISVSSPYEIINGQIYTGGKKINLSYTTGSLIEKTNGKYYFVNRFVFPIDSESSKIEIFLDEGFIVNQEDIFPTASEIRSDGKRVIIVWNFKEKKAGESVPLFVTFSSSGYEWNYMLVILVAALVIALIAWITYYFMKIKKKRGDYEEYLIDAEKKVIEELKKSDRNEMWQKQLQFKTGFSKAKLSRVVRNLESRNLIKKIPFGNTNKIRLS